ncbi:dihydroorotase [Natronospira proteinivora]|uniref:Dihydroorotase n=1 Tax=Natronospira proteinivora TaxID=1807133 RepID=A0ABT1G4N0_9GAMM|nr:dihydroorotase [Natronospira proteinivora]MCP1726244.1 dihydroorotase [Natronospira proteinivora]
MDQLEITRPDDWHLHVRDGAALKAVVPETARIFRRAIIMPNLTPPVTTVAQAEAYRDRVLAASPAGSDFQPLMTLYLTDNTDEETVSAAAAHPDIHAFKLYPAGATTNSDAGVTDIRHIRGALDAMADHDIPLLVHGEVTRPDVDFFDREKRFIDETLTQVVEDFAPLRVVFEHITTREAVAFVESAPNRVAATITPQHLMENRNALFRGGLRPHHFCLPVLKREEDRQALLEAATSGSPQFFLGTDSAPHPKGAKESACGCAGIYSAHTALELYAEIFDAAGCLEQLEAFASHNGSDFYRLPRNRGRVRLERKEKPVPAELPLGEEIIVPFRAGESLAWTATPLESA